MTVNTNTNTNSAIDELSATIKRDNAIAAQNVNTPVDAVPVTESETIVKARATLARSFTKLVDAVTADVTETVTKPDALSRARFLAEAEELASFLYSIDAETRLRAVNAFRIVKSEGKNLCILRSAGVEFPISQNAGGNWSAAPVSVNLYDKYGVHTDTAKYTPKASTNSNPDLGYFKKNICMAGGRMGLECADMAHTEHKAKAIAEAVKRAPKQGSAMTPEQVAQIARDAVMAYIAATTDSSN